ncbi:TPA: PadR family transcriptional regulator [bacterium]|nr:PadR family transcriptional regulator [bacterium]
MSKKIKKHKKMIVKKNTGKTLKKMRKSTPKYVELKGFLSFFILHELSRKDHSGDELARLIGERKGTNLTPGTIYPALKRLRRQKLIHYKKNGRQNSRPPDDEKSRRPRSSRFGWPCFRR